jgi:putative Mn2+ efflux pump MntP
MTFATLALLITLGLDVFAGGLKLGVGGLDRTRWARAALVFAFLAFLMTTLGALFGRLLDGNLGNRTSYIAGAVLIVVGLYALAEIFFGDDQDETPEKAVSTSKLILTGIVVCLDKFAVGVALSFIDVSIPSTIAFLVIQSFFVTLFGISLGKRLGANAGDIAKVVAGLIFVVLGSVVVYQTYTNQNYL